MVTIPVESAPVQLRAPRRRWRDPLDRGGVLERVLVQLEARIEVLEEYVGHDVADQAQRARLAKVIRRLARFASA